MAQTGTGLSAFGDIAKMRDVRQRLFFVVGALVIYRLGTFIPVPGVNPEALVILFEQQRGTIVDVFNMFSGGALSRFSIFALGIMPYISSSIIMQLMSHVVPTLQQLRKEGEAGRRRITQYTRYGAVLLASFQGLGISFALQSQSVGGLPVVMVPGVGFMFTSVVTLATGTLFLMWLGEQITERGIGNGISLIIFAGIVAGLPAAVGGTLELGRTGQLSPLEILFLFALAILVTGFVVFMERGQRRITVNYAKRQGRQAYQAQTSHLPLKINMSGVIPPIFASSLVLFPGTLVGWFGQDSGTPVWVREFMTQLAPGNALYIAIYGGLIIFFAFFYTAMVFNSREIADNLKKSGAFVPGIRPGRQTADYLDKVMTRLTAAGAAYLVGVCLLPEFLILKWNVPFYFGGTSLLIIVVVVMDFIAQLQSHLMSHQYESLLKKANLKGYGRSGMQRG